MNLNMHGSSHMKKLLNLESKMGKEAKTVSPVSKKWKYLVYYIRKQTGVIAVGYILGKLNYLVIFFK